jgi:putative membrane protein
MHSSPSHSNTAANAKLIAWSHRLFCAMLAAAFVFMLVTILAPSLQLPGSSSAPEIALLLMATASTIVALERQLPLQNVLLAASVIGIIGGAAHALGAISGIPFGPFTFTGELGPKFFKVIPDAMPFIWVVVVLNSRGVARLILRPWRKTKSYGFWLMGLAALWTFLFVVALEPFASRIKHYWFWTQVKFPLSWQGAPIVDFLSWGIVTLLILAFVTPALINKRLSKKSSPDFHPLCVWVGGVLICAIACAKNGIWPAVAVDAAIVVATVVFSVRGARW